MVNERDQAESLRPGYLGKGTIVYEPLSALSLTQRLGRLRFACYQLIANLIAMLMLALIMLLAQRMIPPLAGQFGSGIVIIMLAIYLVGLMVRRLHDMDNSGWWALASLIPAVNLLLMLYLLLGAGSGYVNRYGTPNPPPGPLVLFAGGLFWTVNVVGLLLGLTLMLMAWQFPEQLQEIMQSVPFNVPSEPWPVVR